MGQANVTSKDESATKNGAQAIVACTDPEIRQLLARELIKCGLQPVLSETLDDAKCLLKRQETVMAFVQPTFHNDGIREILKAASGPTSRVPIIICSNFYDWDLYVQAMSLGAHDYLPFPDRREEVGWVINNAANRHSLSPTDHG